MCGVCLLLQNLFQSCVLGSVLENEFRDPNRFSVNDGVLYREQKMDCIEYRNGQFRVQKMDFSFEQKMDISTKRKISLRFLSFVKSK